jgi:hypothetical protein
MLEILKQNGKTLVGECQRFLTVSCLHCFGGNESEMAPSLFGLENMTAENTNCKHKRFQSIGPFHGSDASLVVIELERNKPIMVNLL